MPKPTKACLTQPLVREKGSHRPATRDEALDRVATAFRRSIAKNDPRDFGMFSCSKTVNELNYVAQKFVRSIMGTNTNARETHPIFFHHMLKGIPNGAEPYVIDPRRTSSARRATLWMGLNVGSDISLANAVGREITAMRDASICGLGQTVSSALESALKRWSIFS
jgi:predicted molibdopterin-dependent oxidoreductase YjgC